MINNTIRFLLVGFALFNVSIAYAHNEQEHSLDLIPVPDGFQPEGVVRGRGHKAYVGSLLSGAIYRLDLVALKGEIFVKGEDEQTAVGLAFDKRSDYLYVCGGPLGTVKIYDTKTGQLLRSLQTGQSGGFVNDGIVTQDAAYFTDSWLPNIYRLPLSKDGQLASDTELETIPLRGDFVFQPGQFNANGIVADHGSLFVVNSFSGLLYQVEAETGYARQVELAAGDLKNGDGMLLKNDKLYVVQNMLNQIAVVELSEDGSVGEISAIIQNPLFRIPTTITAFGDWLYAINARFDVAPPPFGDTLPADPSTEFELIRFQTAAQDSSD